MLTSLLGDLPNSARRSISKQPAPHKSEPRECSPIPPATVSTAETVVVPFGELSFEQLADAVRHLSGRRATAGLDERPQDRQLIVALRQEGPDGSTTGRWDLRGAVASLLALVVKQPLEDGVRRVLKRDS